MKKGILISVLVCLLITVLLAACQKDPDSTKITTSGALQSTGGEGKVTDITSGALTTTKASPVTTTRASDDREGNVDST